MPGTILGAVNKTATNPCACVADIPMGKRERGIQIQFNL